MSSETMKLRVHSTALIRFVQSLLSLSLPIVNLLFLFCHSTYNKEPKCVTVFDLFTFFHADLIKSEASWKLSSTSDLLVSA